MKYYVVNGLKKKVIHESDRNSELKKVWMAVLMKVLLIIMQLNYDVSSEDTDNNENILPVNRGNVKD